MVYHLCIKGLSKDRIICGSFDVKIKVWCLKSNGCIKTINAHSNIIKDIRVLSDELVVSCSLNKTIKFLNLVSELEPCIKTIENNAGMTSVT